MEIIDNFKGEYAFLSNFYPSPIKIGYTEFPTVEHAYQAYKTNIPAKREEIRLAKTPGLAKRLGQKVKLRTHWEDLKLPIMRALVGMKFEQNPELMEKLVATGKAKLIEGNTWGDTYWGVCNGKGQNKLGEILMIIRDRTNITLI